MKSEKNRKMFPMGLKKSQSPEVDVENKLADESYKIIESILDKFDTSQVTDEAYLEFLKELKVTDVPTIEKEDKSADYEMIKKYIKQKTGKKVTDNELDMLLGADEKNIKRLTIDPYMQDIIRILNQTKVVRRSSDKPMMTPRSQTGIGNSPSEAHLTTRGIHQEQVGDLSAEIAEYIGANINLARAGGKHHDDGHTNSGHTGERIATKIGNLNNCGYIVHNALSADMLISEGVVEQIIDLVKQKETKITPERESQIREDIWYLFDIMISHNGEGKERIIRYNPNKTVEDIINDKNKCYTQKGYDKTITPGSKEAAIIAFADRICYVRTDILDGVNLGILTNLNDEYLQYIGILALKHNQNDRLYTIAQKVFTKEEELEHQMNEFMNRLSNSQTDIGEIATAQKFKEVFGVEPTEFVTVAQNYFIIEDMARDVFEASKEYGRIYVSKIPLEKRAETVANMIKDVCVEDLKEYSYGKDYVGISPTVAKAFFGIRSQNLDQIVQYTRRTFEKELLPRAEYRIHDDLSQALLETGLIREYLSQDSEEEFELTYEEGKARAKYGINEDLTIRGVAKPSEAKKYTSTLLKRVSAVRAKYKYERKACHNFIKLYKYEPDRLAEIYQNALDAVNDITLNDVKLATGELHVGADEVLADEYDKKIEGVKTEIKSKYPKGFSKSEQMAFATELANRRKNDKEKLLASAVALEYVAGMTDGTVLEAAKLKRYLTNGQIRRGYKREGEPEKEFKQMKAFWNQGLDLDKIKNIMLQAEKIVQKDDELSL